MAKVQKIVWELTCDRCGHIWVTKGSDLPKVCSKCKSTHWDTKDELVGKAFILTDADNGAHSRPEKNDLLEVSNIGRLPIEREVERVEVESKEIIEREIIYDEIP